MEPLTIHQQHALEKIRSVQSVQVRQLQAVIDANDHMRGAKPSRWVHETTLVTVHKVNRRHIQALIRKGYLSSRPTDGWGNEVLPIGV